jgi:hypothetical protein
MCGKGSAEWLVAPVTVVATVGWLKFSVADAVPLRRLRVGECTWPLF